MKSIFKPYLFIIILLSLQYATPAQVFGQEQQNALSKIMAHLKTPDENYVLVIAHRGDWRNAPENSILAIHNAIAMGVDIVELDVQKTKDGQLVLMHDKTIDRTTDGTGKVADYTLDELKKFHLRNGLQRPTFHQIPTLEEAMITAKGKVLVNIDKGYDHFDLVYKVLEKTGTTGQAIMKGNVDYSTFKAQYGNYADKLIFMPIVNAGSANAATMLNTYLQQTTKPAACEFSSVPDTNASLLKKFKEIRKTGVRVWMNSLWASQCAGYEDDRAVENTDKIYGWYIANGVNMIQTDRPALLLSWLRSKNLHD